ncbi:MAG: DUF167 domain-containing protein [Rhodospirillales bacterium]|nr:DUF167 domain-containing protein [Rhodospirillales bacterium]
MSVTADRLRLSVRVQHGATHDEIAGIALDDAGNAFLMVRVTRLSEGGRANRAVIKLLARFWRLPAPSIGVARGQRDRPKVLEIGGGSAVAQTIRERLGALT